MGTVRTRLEYFLPTHYRRKKAFNTLTFQGQVIDSTLKHIATMSTVLINCKLLLGMMMNILWWFDIESASEFRYLSFKEVFLLY
jgi:hypothetical protein